ncbi:hypothetical protein HMPREF0083_01155 [Aneurinibacillus aneurinilyticus ATCC 12856]|uniref:Uncharacterized protein n=1 Tax=Aneurinibacillus aneurinilyticus ATCC 12856 TaxID=649747 RepID=U1YF75_ANEAE|nr:hypothetical protein HMPREF0083_01155 [Aneurinibacillus aneurinilyticus ATCC 12856]
MITWLEVGNPEKRGGWMRPALWQKKGQLSFSDRAHPPPFRLFLPPTTKVCRLIKPDVCRRDKERGEWFVLIGKQA